MSAARYALAPRTHRSPPLSASTIAACRSCCPELCAAYAGVAGVFIALIATLAPSQIWAWVGVVFAVVIIGRLGNPLGALAGGILIGVCEAMTMAVVDPSWAPLVSFSVLIALLLFKPRWI